MTGEAPLAPVVTLHASCLRWLGRGVLLRGSPAIGKSDLLLRLLDAGGDLVADDVVRIERRHGRLVARPVALHGAVELRGQGLFRLPNLPGARVDLLVDCVDRTAERLPETDLEAVLGVALPRLALACRDASAPARLRAVLLGAPFHGRA